MLILPWQSIFLAPLFGTDRALSVIGYFLVAVGVIALGIWTVSLGSFIHRLGMRAWLTFEESSVFWGCLFPILMIATIGLVIAYLAA